MGDPETCGLDLLRLLAAAAEAERENRNLLQAAGQQNSGQRVQAGRLRELCRNREQAGGVETFA